ncbi:MAG: TolC family protein [Candidatus Sumerlaeia bacterium]|nr:TolC family protein [Candidatus Sumerlaeia bacterium]
MKSNKFNATLWCACILLATGNLLFADTGNRPDRIVLDGEPVEMSLAEIVDLAITRNIDIEIRRLDARIAGEERRGEYGIYDPTIEGSLRRVHETRDSDRIGGSPRRDHSTIGTVGVTQLLPIGGTLSVEARQSRTNFRDDRRQDSTLHSPNVTQEAVIAIRQPLLKNFGTTVTESGIRIARFSERIAQLSYQQEIIDRLAEVMTAYWDLVFAIRNLEVQEASLTAAQELERVNSARVEAGTAARADLLQARAQAAERRTFVIQAKSDIINAQDRLLRLLNWEDPDASWGAPIIPLDPPDVYDLDLTLDDRDILADALNYRPDFSATMTAREIAYISRDVSRRQRLPELNLLAEWGANSTESTTSDAFDDLRAAHYTSYFYGVEFRYPLLNRHARAAYRAALDGVERANRLIERAELQVVTEVRASTRTIRTAQESIEAANAQVEAATETLDAERRRLDVGASTTFNVLDFQERLARAQVNQVQALVNYQKGLIEVERSRGLLIDAIAAQLGVNIEFDEPAGAE